MKKHFSLLNFMVQRVLILLVLVLVMASSSLFAQSQNIPLGVVHEKSLDQSFPLAPPRPWYITQDDHVFTLSATPVDYVLQLLDEDGVVVYFDYIPAGTTQIILPATLSGEFEFRLVADTYYYRGFISI